MLLLLLLVVPVSAVVLTKDYIEGDIDPSQYGLVTVERDRRLGSFARDRATCINLNKNKFCELDEPMLGPCWNNVCIWPTKTYKPWYSWRYRASPCFGFAVLAGKEYEPLLEYGNCVKSDIYWCCDPKNAFPPFNTVYLGRRGMQAPGPSPTGALLIVDSNKWKALKQGFFRYQTYEQRALQFERQRCAKLRRGQGQIRVIDPKYGSFFADTRNFRPGIRAFFIKPKEVVPLITWC